MSFRITYSSIGQNILLTKNNALTGKAEIREFNGTIYRLGDSCTLEIKDSPAGERPIFGGGEIIVMGKGRNECGKSRTSCWITPAYHSSEKADFFIKPKEGAGNIDIFYALKGDILIYEFDNKNHTFPITVITEGKKAEITFDANQPNIRNRYSAISLDIADSEYDYILSNYIDPRKWR